MNYSLFLYYDRYFRQYNNDGMEDQPLVYDLSFLPFIKFKLSKPSKRTVSVLW